jgi:anti-sigma factor RsiW
MSVLQKHKVMNENDQHIRASDQQDWQAACYLLGELSTAETAAFEQALADDQSAREALARAVAVIEGLRTAEVAGRVVPAVVAARRWRTISLRLAVVLAASMLLAVVIQYESSLTSSAPKDKDLLAEAWLATSRATAALEPSTVTDAGEIWDAEAPLWEDTAATSAPAWMLVAVDDLSTGSAPADLGVPNESRPQ